MENFVIEGCSETTNEINTVIISKYNGNVMEIIPIQIKITSLRPSNAYLIEFGNERFFAFIKTNTINYKGSLSIAIQRNTKEVICNHKVNPNSAESIKIVIKNPKDTIVIYANRSLNMNIIVASAEISRTKSPLFVNEI